MSQGSSLMLDSFWRAAAYCFRPKVIALSLVPLVVMLLVLGGWSYFYWTASVAAVQHWVETIGWLRTMFSWFGGSGTEGFAAGVAPFVVLVLMTPMAAVLALLIIALLMTPALLRMVTEQRFATLAKKHGTGLVASVVWALGTSAVAVVAFVVTMPLWLIPPLVLVVPPVIWGWLTYRVMCVDALAEHASKSERDALLQRHRWPLLLMGVISGYIGIAPSIVWASGIVFTIGFVVLVPLAVWIYAITFAFSSLWFIHFGLAALQALRAEQDEMPVAEAQWGDGKALEGALPAGEQPEK
ncbi:EI24 domain-containing protein [Comamonas odontotermitis]|uniref:EI24 domain-containing protein n=1 Tax=Comamonas odontotermitis TaxID=379895 RepID=UPI00366DF134